MDGSKEHTNKQTNVTEFEIHKRQGISRPAVWTAVLQRRSCWIKLVIYRCAKDQRDAQFL